MPHNRNCNNTRSDEPKPLVSNPFVAWRLAQGETVGNLTGVQSVPGISTYSTNYWHKLCHKVSGGRERTYAFHADFARKCENLRTPGRPLDTRHVTACGDRRRQWRRGGVAIAAATDDLRGCCPLAIRPSMIPPCPCAEGGRGMRRRAHGARGARSNGLFASGTHGRREF